MQSGLYFIDIQDHILIPINIKQETLIIFLYIEGSTDWYWYETWNVETLLAGNSIDFHYELKSVWK